MIILCQFDGCGVDEIHTGGGKQAPAQPAPATAADGGEMKIQMAIVHPEIIVVENAMTMDTNALILSVSIHA